MKAFLTVVSSVVVALASQVAVADTAHPMFRTDRLSVVKPAPKLDAIPVTRTHVKRGDRVDFYKTEVKQDVQQEVVRRNDHITFYKTK